MTLRKVTEKDRTALMALWQEVFEDEPAFLESFFDTVFPESVGFAAEEDGRLCGMAYLVPCRVACAGRETGCDYLYALGVRASERKKGVGRALLAAAQKDAVRRERAAILTVPAEPGLFDYYGDAGYKTWAWASACSFGAERRAAVRECAAEEYLRLREDYLSGGAAAYVRPIPAVARLSRFFVWDGGLLAAERSQGEWLGSELCGSAAGAPTAAAMLGAPRLTVIRCGGGYPYAMALPLSGEFPSDGAWSFGMQ